MGIRGRRYLHYVSGQEVFAINPDPATEFTATSITVQGTPPPASTPHGIYSRARYVPELDIYVVVSNPNQNVYFFKFASTQRPL